jgi:hypothetical protein
MQANLQRRVDMFEKIAAAAGAALDDPVLGDPVFDDGGLADTVPSHPVPFQSAPSPSVPFRAMPFRRVPPALLAAARAPQPRGCPVRLAVGGVEVIAVIGDEGGDPRDWLIAIHRLMSRSRDAS